MVQVQFIPGRLAAPQGPLARYRPIQSTGAVGAYVEALTQPGALVVDLFCQGSAFVREAAAAGRRALGFSVNPVLLTIVRLGLSQCSADALNAAFTRLADSPKGDVSLRQHMTTLYHSACPTCGALGIAEWFVWDRDGDYPFEKAVRCPECNKVQAGTPDGEDIESARRLPPRGLAYYYALDRAAPPDHPARERAAQLVELYTPRNLSALMDLAMRLEGLEAGEEEVLALTGVLLDCFDAGSNLDPYDEERPRPRTLRTPSRYIERNVWLCFEQGIARLLASEEHLPIQQAPDVATLMGGNAAGYALASHAARDVWKTMPAQSAALIFIDPPRPDGVFWALSALWAGWLWESPAAQAMRPFLRRRRFDWDWHFRVLETALKAVGPLLVPEGHVVTLFSGPDEALLESVCLAATGAGYALNGWGYSPGAGYRLVWRWEQDVVPSTGSVDGRREITTAELEAFERELMTAAEQALVNTLQERGEPTEWALLHSSAYAGLAERGLLARVAAIPEDGDGPKAFAFAADAVRRAFEAAPITQLTSREGSETALWDLVDSSHAAGLLADRVGVLVRELLAQLPAWAPEELVDAVYARLPGPVTPDLALVLVCIDSYSVREDDVLRLRPEDNPRRRAAERKTLRNNLMVLGKRLGFKVKRGRGWDVRWLVDGREAYVFDVSVAVTMGRHLLTERDADEGAQRCLVVPGGRAGLIDFKLQRDHRLAHAVERDGWQFIKFRHLRRLLAEEDLDRHALKTVLGLDPIVEQEAAQIPLF